MAGNPRILVVDDNRDAAEMLAVALAPSGADLRLAASGLEALATLDAFAADVVFLDISMPGMDGHELARRIRAREDGARLRLIALSGLGDEATRLLSRAVGIDVHLVKPVDLEQIETLLATL